MGVTRVSKEKTTERDNVKCIKRDIKRQRTYVRMREQFLHDKIVVNFPGQFPSFFGRFQFLVAFNL